MALDFLARNRAANIPDLIARKSYPKAIEILRAQLGAAPDDARLRLQIADVLVLADQGWEAVPILEDLAKEFARDGFAAKSIAVLKRIQKLEPGRKDVANRLASLLQEKLRHTTASIRVQEPNYRSPAEIAMDVVDRPAAVDLSAPAAGAPEPAPEPTPPTAEEPVVDLDIQPLPEGGEIVATPLFPDFSQEELLAVMGGLSLMTFDPGDIIVSEGEPGDSLFILSTGSVKVFVRDPTGHHVLIRQMREGDFFGEISVLSGSPRTATVTAATRCELLELDRAGLQGITASYPRVRGVLQDFYVLRTHNEAEARIRGGQPS